jgi:uncharacterized protein YgiM (DUF1202 family)
MKIRFTVLLGFILTLTSIGLLIAQGTCPAIVEVALQSMGNNCDDLGRNSVCYGYDLVGAEFSEEVNDDFFAQPADIAELGILETIRTSEMNETTSQWGVAVMSLQANIPNSIPGQAVKFVLMGDVEVESAVEPENVSQSVDAIAVTVLGDANIRSGAGLTYNVIGGIANGETLMTDGQSDDGNWYRTVVGNRIGWVFRDLVEPDDRLTSLPILSGTSRSLMQSFYLRTGFGVPTCEEAPEDTLMIQGPENIEIDLNINGADIRIGSTIVVRILSPGDVIEFTVIDGKMVVPGAGPNGTDLIIYENHRTTACLTEPDNRGVDGNSNDRLVGCGDDSWTAPEFIPDTPLGEAFCILENVPENLLNYEVDLTCPNIGDEPISIIIDDTGANPPSDSAPPEATEEPTDDNNLCSEGNAWDDGRCTSDYWWQAGFYFGQVEKGVITIDQVPNTYNPSPTATPTPTPEPEEKKSKERCQDGIVGPTWDIYEVRSGPSWDYIKTVSSDPGLPICGF